MTTTYFFSLRVIEDDRGVFCQWGTKEKNYPGKTAKEILPEKFLNENGSFDLEKFLDKAWIEEGLMRNSDIATVAWFWSQLPEPEEIN